MTLLFFYFALAVVVSFLCSVLEAVLLSLTPSFIQAVKKTGSRTGRLLDKLKRNVDRPLAAILSLNTIAHTVGAAGVGAQAQRVFENVPLSIISGILTLLILVFSEIIPKTLGAIYWRPLAVPSAYVIQGLIYPMWPLVLLSRSISRLLRRDGENARISREEINAMTDLGQREGVIDEADARVLRSALHFPSVRVTEVMTPRPVVKVLSTDETIRQAMDRLEELTFSRYPVLSDPETIYGFALRSDILESAARDAWTRTIGDLSSDVIILPEQATVKHALKVFLSRHEHLAVVVDEFGSFSGVVTLEDAIETLIGQEIIDEGDEVEDMRILARKLSANLRKWESTNESGE
ncbi:MAG: CNNM domain-containing protein [Puniceicoccaceae bacterium]